jgi:hypothetical protein
MNWHNFEVTFLIYLCVIMCTHPILVAEYFKNHNLVTREYATLLIEKATSTLSGLIELDFSGISFVSRSFADQFHKEKINLWETEKKEIIVINTEPDVSEMLKTVSKTQSSNNRVFESYPHLQFQSRRFLKEYLFSV